ncbi:MAG: hypothetical protein Q4B79_01785 [Moraxella sp.]|uniref:hypothetical protein n=1 Tax=Moraxella sp. TaxID=479 RepID=UPI0026DB72CE|nr:hypothetical protein [Moraxella sp.]MDO4449673.1 hypothetical protein [Moraxella sp.]
MMTKWLLCINNDGYPASLHRLKSYCGLDDDMADKLGMVRVIDESGEDYLYDACRFLLAAREINDTAKYNLVSDI